MSEGWTRRDMLKAGGIAMVATGLGCQTASKPATKPLERNRVTRIAHLTDMHMQPEKNAEAWSARCFHAAQEHTQPPDLIINGGDIVMDSLHAKKDRVSTEWEVVQRVLKNECSLPIVQVIGNHDIWGWDQDSSGASPADALYGKAWIQDALGLDQRYYSKDVGNWRLIVLDSNHIGKHRVYDARLDEEQFTWLTEELKATPAHMYVMIVSHIPILCAAAYFDGDNAKTGDWIVPGAWMHQDARELKDLFYQHRNVRLAISGHIHLLDRVDYDGVTYLCNGAVCGNWWKGLYQETPPGYAMIDLYDDGSFESEYITYGWKEA